MDAIQYLRTGTQVALQKENLPFVVVPIIINLLVFAVTISWAIGVVQDSISNIVAWLPSWLAWLQHIIVPATAITLVLIFSLSFTMLANLIASPFYGVLSEKVAYQQGHVTSQDQHLQDVFKTGAKAIQRELQKIGYYLPRAIAIWILGFFLPFVNVAIWFGFNAWMQSIQYLDFPIDNQKQPFKNVRAFAATHKRFSFSFGAILQLLSLVPLANLVIMPAAVCGATVFWCHSQET